MISRFGENLLKSIGSCPRNAFRKEFSSLQCGYLLREGQHNKLVQRNIVLFGAFLRELEQRVRNAQCIIAHRRFLSRSKNCDGDSSSTPRVAQAAAKSFRLNVTSASAREFSAVSN